MSEIQQELVELERDQAAQRYVAESESRTATATVHGVGALLELRIDDRVLRRGHPGLIGSAILEAVHAARSQAGAGAGEAIRQILDPTLPAYQPSEHSHAVRQPGWQSSRTGSGELFSGADEELFDVNAESGLEGENR